MADIVLLFILKGRDCMSKVLIEVLVIILIAGSYLILYSTVRVSAIADQRIAEIRSRETFDKEKQLKTNQSSISGGMAMANKEKKIEGRLGYNSENGRYVYDLLKADNSNWLPKQFKHRKGRTNEKEIL